MKDFSKQLEYGLPKNPDQAMQQLAKVLRVPTHKLQGDTNMIVASMAGTVLYRHLSRQDKYSVMKMIRGLQNGPLKDELITKCLDPIVKPQWAEWSMTNDELQSAVDFHNEFNRWSSVLGANPGAYGVGGATWSIIKDGVSRGNIAVFAASIVLFGLHEFSYNETQKYSTELERRKTFRGVQ